MAETNKKIKLLSKLVGGAKRLPRRSLSQFKRKVTYVIIAALLIGFGGAWYWRGRTISAQHRQLSSVRKELQTTKDDLKNERDAQAGLAQTGCTGGFDGFSSACPSLKVIKSERRDDSNLKSGQYFLVVQLELTNANKSNITLDPSQLKLKDKNNFVYTSFTPGYYGGEGSVEYKSVESVQTINSQMTLATGEKIRGNVVFQVSSPEMPLTLTYFTEKSDTFTP